MVLLFFHCFRYAKKVNIQSQFFLYIMTLIYIYPKKKLQNVIFSTNSFNHFYYECYRFKLCLKKSDYCSVIDWTDRSIAYCISMWCTLRIPPRSTRHSAVWLCCCGTQSHPYTERLDFRPSTARSAPYMPPCFHADLLKAMFSVKYVIIFKRNLHGVFE